jgi:hypothetical protein
VACCRVLTPLGVGHADLADTHYETAARLSIASHADQFGPWREAGGVEEPPWLWIYYKALEVNLIEVSCCWDCQGTNLH